MLKLITCADNNDFFEISSGTLEKEDGKVISVSKISTKIVEGETDPNTNETSKPFSKDLVIIEDGGNYANLVLNSDEYKKYRNNETEVLDLANDIRYQMMPYRNNKGTTSDIVKIDFVDNPTANIFVIAVPFTGSMQNIPEDPKYRILKALIIRSKCKNTGKAIPILYLVISVNYKLFDPEHKYHTKTINIVFNYYDRYDLLHGTKEVIISNDDIHIKNLYVEGVDKPPFRNNKGESLWVLYDKKENTANNLSKDKPKKKAGNTFESSYQDYSDKEYARQYGLNVKKGGPAKKKKKKSRR